MNPDPLQPLRDASAGLLYPSETDAPFELFRWPAAAGRTARDAVARRTHRSPIDEQPVDGFFGPLADTDDADRFAAIRATLERSLADLTVVRAGRVRVAVYLIGRSRDGGWAGLHTTSVET